MRDMDVKLINALSGTQQNNRSVETPPEEPEAVQVTKKVETRRTKK